MYASISMIGLVLFAWIMPETKGTPLEEVENLFAEPKKRNEEEFALLNQTKL